MGKTRGGNDAKGFVRRDIEAQLITGVPTPGFLAFETIPGDVRALAVLYLDLFVRDPDTGISVGSDQVDFRNVTVTVKR
jgi:hypothetical protein